MVVLAVREVSKTYRRGELEVQVLNHIDLDLGAGDFVSLMGPSGSGKTTLLNIVGGLDSPSSGSVHMNGTDIAALDDAALSTWRTSNVGFVFQQFNLLPVLTAAENVELPLLLFDMTKAERRRRALDALEIVGLEERANHYPRQLSGGEEQRTAVARALVTDPKLIIADEPTGSLDAEAAGNVLDLLQTLNGRFHKTVVMVTHDAQPRPGRRVSRLNKGVLVNDASETRRDSLKFLPLILRNLRRNRRRTVLTTAGIGLSVFVVTALLAVEAGFETLFNRGRSLLNVYEKGVACAVTSRVFDGYLPTIGVVPHVDGATGVLRGLYSYREGQPGRRRGCRLRELPTQEGRRARRQRTDVRTPGRRRARRSRGWRAPRLAGRPNDRAAGGPPPAPRGGHLRHSRHVARGQESSSTRASSRD